MYWSILFRIPVGRHKAVCRIYMLLYFLGNRTPLKQTAKHYYGRRLFIVHFANDSFRTKRFSECEFSERTQYYSNGHLHVDSSSRLYNFTGAFVNKGRRLMKSQWTLKHQRELIYSNYWPLYGTYSNQTCARAGRLRAGHRNRLSQTGRIWLL